MSSDSSMAVYSRRGIWFCRAVLTEIGAEVLSPEDWHERFGKFPKTLTGVCSVADVFRHIGEHAQDSLVGTALEESKTQASVLIHLEELGREGALSQRQEERFTQGVRELNSSAVRASGLSTKTLYEKLIDAMTSYNWYVQNPAIDTVLSNGPEQAAELSQDQQVELGRNILQCGEGMASSAIELLEKLSHGTVRWPFDVIRGIALESFCNEENEIRLKSRQLHLVLSALSHFNIEQREEVIGELTASLDSGTLKYRARQDLHDDAIGLLNSHEWTAPVVRALERRLKTG
jgi:hypothetical protein